MIAVQIIVLDLLVIQIPSLLQGDGDTQYRINA